MALFGMTGFARLDAAVGGVAFALEARSVNGRQLEVRFRGPEGFEGCERRARELAAARFARGQISLSVRTSAALEGRPGSGLVDEARLEALVALAAKFAGRDGLAAARLDGLLALPGVLRGLTAEPGAELAAAVEERLEPLFEALLAERRREGESLGEILKDLLSRLEEAVGAAGSEAEGQPAMLKARFEARLKALSAGGDLEPRAALEAAVLAARSDVREELDRLALHLASARSLIAGPGPHGRRLDFLAQEFMREANTLCAKSAVPGLTERGLEMKALIDQLREQVQNVE